jgi:hypothetical protein
LFHVWGGIAFRGDQHRAQGSLNDQLLLGTLRDVGEGLEQRQPHAQVLDGFHIG